MSSSAALLAAYPSIAAIHASVGVLALATFWSAAFARKGTAVHRRIGQAYLCAMLGILATGVPLAAGKWLQGHPVSAAFLGYLLLLTAAAIWGAWRSIRDRGDVARYTGRTFVALGLATFAAGAGILALGVLKGVPLLIGFSLVGLVAGTDMLRKRIRRAQLAQQPLWWRREHYSAMLGNAVATHVAFLSIGLPKLLPMLDGPALSYAAWFGPLLIATVAKAWLDRKYRVGATRMPQGMPARA